VNKHQHTAPLRLKRDIDLLFKEARPLAKAGRDTAVVAARYVVRELAEGEVPILILYHAPKKFTKPAHERNKLKRWMREAVRLSEEMASLSEMLSGNKKQVLLLVRITTPPSPSCNWQHISADMRSIGKKLVEIQGASLS
jgi:ribonuclease P protein component